MDARLRHLESTISLGVRGRFSLALFAPYQWLSMSIIRVFLLLIVLLMLSVLVLIVVWRRDRRETSNREADSMSICSERICARTAPVLTVSNTDQNSSPENPHDGRRHEIDLSAQVQAAAISRDSMNFASKNSKMLHMTGASVMGRSHREAGISCQDSHRYESWGNGWGIAVVSDGAGSASHSHIGSRYVAQRAVERFSELVRNERWIRDEIMPSTETWCENATSELRGLRNDLESFAQQQNLEFSSLAATLIIVVLAPTGILLAHIGDGRAAFRDEGGTWKAMMTPFRGEEVNSTWFLTSRIWDNLEAYVECKVHLEGYDAFAILTDGCENSSFEWNIRTSEDSALWFDPNRPYPGFFDPVIDVFAAMTQDGLGASAIQEIWSRFLEAGNRKLLLEDDDKTMIIGISIPSSLQLTQS